MQSISTASASLARVHIDCGFARLALDVAAPDELAVTPRDVLLHLQKQKLGHLVNETYLNCPNLTKMN
jgi:hypothetical protein